jgi:hypothetical protein
VSQTKSTPDEPVRGSVATGQHPPAESTDGGTGSDHGGGNGGGNGRAAAAPGGEPTTLPPAPPVAAADRPVDDPHPVGSTPAAPEAVTQQFRTPTEATATTQFRVPAEATESSEAGDGASPAAGTAHPAGRPETESPAAAAPTLDPVPAPAVPAPGPGAAPPPPWKRMPGTDGAERTESAATSAQAPSSTSPTSSTSSTSSAADRLLDDGPTAFLEAPRRPPSPAASTTGDSPVGETGGWARVTRTRPPRQAALQLKRLDPWSVLKLALVLAVVLFFIWLVAVGVLYGVLDGMGVWDRLNGTYADLVSGEAQTGSTLISAGRVFGLAAVIGAINSLLFAVAVTVGAFVYNVSADLVGGIEVTLSERD